MSIEDMLRQIIREELKLIHHQVEEIRNIVLSNHYPPSLTVNEAAQIAKVGKRRIYEWANHPDFPKIQESERGKIVIPTKPFLKWLEEYAPQMMPSA